MNAPTKKTSGKFTRQPEAAAPANIKLSKAPYLSSSARKQATYKPLEVAEAPPEEFEWMAFNGDTSEIIKDMRNGTPARLIPDLATRFGISQDKLFETLRLPKSTLKGRISKNAMLSSSEQDRMYRANKVWDRALAVLEDEHGARTWITRENRSLGGEAPLSLLDTEAGYELVLDTLARIEYGVVS